MSTLLFYATIGYTWLRYQLQPYKFRWYDRVDENVVLGALPFRSMVEQLKVDENIGGVVCCNEQYELDALAEIARKRDWEDANIAYHHIPMRDFTGCASTSDLQLALKFMSQITSNGKSIYVHCKAGRSRSASVAVCYLMHQYDFTQEKAINTIKNIRPRIVIYRALYEMINEWRNQRGGINNGTNHIAK